MSGTIPKTCGSILGIVPIQIKQEARPLQNQFDKHSPDFLILAVRIQTYILLKAWTTCEFFMRILEQELDNYAASTAKCPEVWLWDCLILFEMLEDQPPRLATSQPPFDQNARAHTDKGSAWLAAGQLCSNALWSSRGYGST